MVDDPGVRSVRVATALCDRYAELLKGPQHVSARKQQGALFGVAGNETEFSLRLGEAQQIYPEIWRHLDDARTTFAARGIDLTAYDQIRIAEGNVSLGAAPDVTYAQHGVGRTAIEESIKSANFNHNGLNRARMACAALMNATPDINWAAIAHAEANDPAAAAFKSATRTKRWLSLGAIGLVIASPFLYVMWSHHRDRVRAEERRDAWQARERQAAKDRELMAAPLPPAEQAQLAQSITQLRTQIAAARAAWATATAPDALGKLQPGTAPCPFKFDGPADTTAKDYIRTGDAAPSELGDNFVAFRAGNPIPDLLGRTDSQIESLGRRLDANKLTKTDQAYVDDIELDVPFVITDQEQEPDVTSTAPKIAYTSGHVTGKGYVFSIRDAKVVCTAAIDVKNSAGDAELQDVRRAPDARELLHRELEIRIRQALATGLRAVP